MVVVDECLQQLGDRRRLDSNDFISQMPDEILGNILSFLNVKDAVATSSLSTRWRFMWRNVNRLNFHAVKKNFDGVDVDKDWVFVLEMDKYIYQVNTVIRNYNHSKVQDFRIHYGFNCLDKGVIDGWLQFAVNRKVELLELNFTNQLWNRQYAEYYNFPTKLFERNLCRSNAVVVELVSLKKLILKNVNVRDAILQEFLKKSPYLETISIHDSKYLNHIHVGGTPLNLKHLEIKNFDYVESVKSIHLYDFDLLSFTYKGAATDNFHLAQLPKLKDIHLDMNLKRTVLNEDLLDQISSCASSLQSLYISTYGYSYEKIFTPDSFPVLPNLKKLTLSIDEDNCLLYVGSILNSCPKLRTFAIEDEEIDIRLAHLSKDVQCDMGHGLAGLNNNNMFGQMISSPMQDLSILLNRTMESKELDFFPELPNVKKLRLTAYGHKFNFLLDFASILNACPNMEIFSVEPFWISPILRKQRALLIPINT